MMPSRCIMSRIRAASIAQTQTPLQRRGGRLSQFQHHAHGVLVHGIFSPVKFLGIRFLGFFRRRQQEGLVILRTGRTRLFLPEIDYARGLQFRHVRPVHPDQPRGSAESPKTDRVVYGCRLSIGVWTVSIPQPQALPHSALFDSGWVAGRQQQFCILRPFRGSVVRHGASPFPHDSSRAEARTGPATGIRDRHTHRRRYVPHIGVRRNKSAASRSEAWTKPARD